MGYSGLQLCDLLYFLNNIPWMKAQFVIAWIEKLDPWDISLFRSAWVLLCSGWVYCCRTWKASWKDCRLSGGYQLGKKNSMHVLLSWCSWVDDPVVLMPSLHGYMSGRDSTLFGYSVQSSIDSVRDLSVRADLLDKQSLAKQFTWELPLIPIDVSHLGEDLSLNSTCAYRVTFS